MVAVTRSDTQIGKGMPDNAESLKTDVSGNTKTRLIGSKSKIGGSKRTKKGNSPTYLKKSQEILEMKPAAVEDSEVKIQSQLINNLEVPSKNLSSFVESKIGGAKATPVQSYMSGPYPIENKRVSRLSPEEDHGDEKNSLDKDQVDEDNWESVEYANEGSNRKFVMGSMINNKFQTPRVNKEREEAFKDVQSMKKILTGAVSSLLEELESQTDNGPMILAVSEDAPRAMEIEWKESSTVVGAFSTMQHCLDRMG